MNQPTMNLEGFTMSFPADDTEFRRIVRHETGHTLGFVHEHLRKGFVDKIVRQAAYDYYEEQFHWSQAMVDQQILTPVDESSLTRGTEDPDQDSLMCYNIPGSITTDGVDIVGGTDIDAADRRFVQKLYPPVANAPPPVLTPVPVENVLRLAEAAGAGAGPLLCFPPGADPKYVAAVVAALGWGRDAATEIQRLRGSSGRMT
jgi:hypothetical protein